MIRNLKNTIATAYPWDVNPKDLSVCSISTTNVVYLVFSDDFNAPDYAVRPIDGKADLEQFELEKVLFDSLGNLVPKPVSTLTIDGADFSIHEGIKGLPWFKIQSLIGDKYDWEILRKASINALTTFNNALFESPAGFKTRFFPEEALGAVVSSFRKYEPEIYKRYEKQIQLELEPLYNLKNMVITKQHGDFCINNLIFSSSDCTVIDLEDFGVYNYPCYDAITLATTLNSAQPNHCDRSLDQEIMECITSIGMNKVLVKSEVKALFLVYLLCRLGRWSYTEKRLPYRIKLISEFEKFFDKS